jgi:uncharacterized membrane protein
MTVRKRYIEHYHKTHLYLIMCACFTTMCEFIGYETRDKNRMKNKIAEDWEAEPELEKVQEEQQQQQPVPVTQ